MMHAICNQKKLQDRHGLSKISMDINKTYVPNNVSIGLYIKLGIKSFQQQHLDHTSLWLNISTIPIRSFSHPIDFIHYNVNCVNM